MVSRALANQFWDKILHFKFHEAQFAEFMV
uniref:Uncharacterized protein n=1 Tax=Rhizophora mucronata TaxID=61149 RepID=A0A2P2PXS2_RHIMU